MVDLHWKWPGIRFTDRIVPIFTILFFMLLVGQTAYSANKIDIKLRVDGLPLDTIWVGYTSSFDFYIENDEILVGMSLGVRFWSPNGASWPWLEEIQKVDLIYDPGCMCMRPDTIWSPLVFEQDSRIYPPWDIFDYFPFDVHPHSPEAFNGISPDTIKIGGVSGMPPDLEPGIKEHMFSILFEAGGIAIDEVKTICLDGAQIISQPDFVFAGIISGPIHPIVGWPEGGKCWPVKRMPCICCLDYSYQGDANVDGSLNVGDAVFLIDHIFKNGPAPASKYCGEANGDGVLNVGDAVYMINYVFKNGDPPVWYLGP